MKKNTHKYGGNPHVLQGVLCGRITIRPYMVATVFQYLGSTRRVPGRL